MLHASADTILADFNNTSATHFSQKAVFFNKTNRYFAKVWNEGENPKVYEVLYTFGFYPLQQYLVKTENGKMQVLPFAWDTREKKEGGKRWMHLYSEDIKSNDRLHWLQPLQNWNGMCADCHSDDLKRNYDVKTNSFDTHWENVNVSCASCHDGLSKKHYQKKSPSGDDNQELAKGKWHRPEKARTAFWRGSDRDNSFMDGCFACHSLRSPLTDGFDSNKTFLNQFKPTLPNAPTYHVDGQLNEEAYIYGSFLQSKMYQQGVNCLDCHNAHSYELKFEGNAVCTQCHSPTVFDSTLHHGHKSQSDGAQCVNCHMPSTTYMAVDARRDHSFKIPRPDISQKYQTPSACQTCHTDKSHTWAVNEIAKLAPKDGLVTTQPLSVNRKNLLELQSGKPLTYQAHLNIVQDLSISDIERAGALTLFSNMSQPLSPIDAKDFLEHPNPLLRMAVIPALRHHADGVKAKLISPLLRDSHKAVRIDAASELVGVTLPSDMNQDFVNAFAQWQHANAQMQFRGEAHVNSALLLQKLNNIQGAIDAYSKAIEIDPYFDAPYINLTDIYRVTNQNEKAKQLYIKGLAAIPHSAALNYSYGLYFIRQKQLAKAMGLLKKAHQLEMLNAQYAYMYFLALHTYGNSQAAFCELNSYINTKNGDPNLRQLLNAIQAQAATRFSCQ